MLSVDELKQEPEWKSLTPAEQKWFEKYVATGGDVMAATKEAFATTSDQSARVLGRRVMQRPLVSTLLNVANEEEARDLETLVKRLWEIVDSVSATAANKVAAANLISDLRGYKKIVPVKEQSFPDILKDLE
jgi:hypothetical protein